MSIENSCGDPSNFGDITIPVDTVGVSNLVFSAGSGGWSTTVMSDELKDTNERLDRIEGQLLILRVDQALHEKYPALKEAYEHYKLIEKMVRG
jgi:hypothetical protein